ncbi:hypothetical protein CLV63_1518 [Murinocardiopsis flavida]|uniref:Uncharacterized protein n=1 Tax=Murinocardiopsis flavida TaxID=645275 RepID=A0A2P8C7B1_9ACTN|nr:hypothetical protein [Murinocardiopsis flavida]PSK80862.1 hypothetical protein CLV63_1518 [Murinocardiopsis flavida]
MTVSLSGAAGAACAGASGGAPVLVISDDLVTLRLDATALDSEEAAALGGSLASAVDAWCADLAAWAVRELCADIPPPPYARPVGGADE